jgi:hypothetical protein
MRLAFFILVISLATVAQWSVNPAGGSIRARDSMRVDSLRNADMIGSDSNGKFKKKLLRAGAGITINSASDSVSISLYSPTTLVTGDSLAIWKDGRLMMTSAAAISVGTAANLKTSYRPKKITYINSDSILDTTSAEYDPVTKNTTLPDDVILGDSTTNAPLGLIRGGTETDQDKDSAAIGICFGVSLSGDPTRGAYVFGGGNESSWHGSLFIGSGSLGEINITSHRNRTVFGAAYFDFDMYDSLIDSSDLRVLLTNANTLELRPIGGRYGISMTSGFDATSSVNVFGGIASLYGRDSVGITGGKLVVSTPTYFRRSVYIDSLKSVTGMYHVKTFSDLTTLVGTVGSPANWSLDSMIIPTADITVPDNINLARVLSGAGIDSCGPYTVTISKMSCDPMFQWIDTSALVVFSAGAVPQVRPEWWGAKSDNSTICKTAIQKATDALIGGGVLQFSDGVYLTGADTITNNGIWFRGNGKSSIVKLMDGANSFVFGIYYTQTADSITFSDFVIDGNKSGAYVDDYNRSCIDFGGSDITVERMAIYNPIAAGICIGANSTGEKNIKILDNVVSNPGIAGKFWGGIAVVNGSDILISRNTVSSIDHQMSYAIDYEPNGGWEIGNNIEISNNICLEGNIVTSDIGDVTIKNNYVRADWNPSGGPSMISVITDYGKTVIKDNYVEVSSGSTSPAIRVSSAGTRIVGDVSGNTVVLKSPYEEGVAVQVTDAVGFKFTKNTIFYPGDVQYYANALGKGIVESGTSNDNVYSNNTFSKITKPYTIVGAASKIHGTFKDFDGTEYVYSTLKINSDTVTTKITLGNDGKILSSKLGVGTDVYGGTTLEVQGAQVLRGQLSVYGPLGPNGSASPDSISHSVVYLSGSKGPSGNDGGHAEIKLISNGYYDTRDYAAIKKDSATRELRIYNGVSTCPPGITLSAPYSGPPNVTIPYLFSTQHVVGSATNNSTIDSSGVVLNGSATEWDDEKIVATAFDYIGTGDPDVTTWEMGTFDNIVRVWQSGDKAYFTCQFSHGRKVNSDVYAHIHWTPHARGASESGSTVNWVLGKSWSSISGTFPAMDTVWLNDTCTGINDAHLMTRDILISGSGKGFSSILTGYVERAAGDTWVGTTAAQSPGLLEIDFHYEIDKLGSNNSSSD